MEKVAWEGITEYQNVNLRNLWSMSIHCILLLFCLFYFEKKKIDSQIEKRVDK